MNRKYTIEVFNKHAVITSNFSIDDKDYLKFKQVEDMLNNPNDYRISKRMHLKVNNDDAGFDAYFHEKPYEGHTMARIATYNNHPFCTIPKITKVIFNDPATIVFWADGTKTVVKCDDGECFDREKGLAMAVSKKALGNQGNYYNEFKKWLPDKMHVAPNLRVKPNSVTLDCTEASLNPMELCSSKILEEFDKWMAKRYQLRKKGDQNDL